MQEKDWEKAAREFFGCGVCRSCRARNAKAGAGEVPGLRVVGIGSSFQFGPFKADRASLTPETKGLLLGVVGVAAFSLTLPATRAAVETFSPLFVGLGRAVVAALPAAVFLAVRRFPLPNKNELKSLALVALGLVIGFPLLTAWAMRYVDASHGGIMLGILPLTTATAGVIFARERPSIGFWLTALFGGILVVAFPLIQGARALRLADLALLAAVVSASVGYAVGARLTRSMGGLQVISWALVLSAPFLIIPLVLCRPLSIHLQASSCLGFLYVCLVSQFLGFIPWYRGLALGGIARVAQTQLLQPFFTIFAASILLQETVDAGAVSFALLVVATVAVGSRMKMGRDSTLGQ